MEPFHRLLAAFINLFFHGHVPGKNAITREQLRKDAAKPGPQAGTRLARGTKALLRLFGELNMFIILSFVIVGAFYVRPENWVPFAPNGLEGIFSGAFIIFFAVVFSSRNPIAETASDI